jgi:hypothetical protein
MKWDLGIETSSSEVAHGIRAVAKEFRNRLPDTRLFLLGIFRSKTRRNGANARTTMRFQESALSKKGSGLPVSSQAIPEL